VDVPEYTRRYREDVLAPLDRGKVMKGIKWLGQGKDVVLCCWEKSGFCHRHLVAEWLGIEEAEAI